jgi:hypothetical protein
MSYLNGELEEIIAEPPPGLMSPTVWPYGSLRYDTCRQTHSDGIPTRRAPFVPMTHVLSTRDPYTILSLPAVFQPHSIRWLHPHLWFLPILPLLLFFNNLGSRGQFNSFVLTSRLTWTNPSKTFMLTCTNPFRTFVQSFVELVLISSRFGPPFSDIIDPNHNRLTIRPGETAVLFHMR